VTFEEKLDCLQKKYESKPQGMSLWRITSFVGL